MAEQVKTENYKPIKNLPKNDAGQLTFEPFEANGHRYLFLRPGDEIGIVKWKHYQQLSVVAGVGRTFADIVSELQKTQEILGSDQPLPKSRIEAILRLDSLMKGILDMSRERFDKAFYLVSLFIYRDGESPYEWDMNTAERNIQDWTEENISPEDLFFFASLLLHGFREKFRELSEKAAQTAIELPGGIG